MINPVVIRARDLYLDGYDLEQITSVLKAQGNSEETTNLIIDIISDEDLCVVRPPKNFNDIIPSICVCLFTKPAKEIIKLLNTRTSLGQIIPFNIIRELDLEKLFLLFQETNDKELLNEIFEILSHYFNNLILNILDLYKQDVSIKYSDIKVFDKYLEYFGIWNPSMIKSFYEGEKGEIEFVSEIDILTNEDGREQTFCPMYKTEINVNVICESCPFYIYKNKCCFKNR